MSFWLCQLAGKSSFKGDRSTSQESGKGNFPFIGILQQLRKNLLVFERPFTTLRPDSAWSCTCMQQQKSNNAQREKPNRGISHKQTLRALHNGRAGTNIDAMLRRPMTGLAVSRALRQQGRARGPAWSRHGWLWTRLPLAEAALLGGHHRTERRDQEKRESSNGRLVTVRRGGSNRRAAIGGALQTGARRLAGPVLAVSPRTRQLGALPSVRLRAETLLRRLRRTPADRQGAAVTEAGG